MEKEELRPVEYTFNDVRKKGYFHRWVISKFIDNGEEYALALIENENGEVVQIAVQDGRLKFTDRGPVVSNHKLL